MCKIVRNKYLRTRFRDAFVPSSANMLFLALCVLFLTVFRLPILIVDSNSNRQLRHVVHTTYGLLVMVKCNTRLFSSQLRQPAVCQMFVSIRKRFGWYWWNIFAKGKNIVLSADTNSDIRHNTIRMAAHEKSIVAVSVSVTDGDWPLIGRQMAIIVRRMKWIMFQAREDIIVALKKTDRVSRRCKNLKITAVFGQEHDMTTWNCN